MHVLVVGLLLQQQTGGILQNFRIKKLKFVQKKNREIDQFGRYQSETLDHSVVNLVYVSNSCAFRNMKKTMPEQLKPLLAFIKYKYGWPP